MMFCFKIPDKRNLWTGNLRSILYWHAQAKLYDSCFVPGADVWLGSAMGLYGGIALWS